MYNFIDSIVLIMLTEKVSGGFLLLLLNKRCPA